MMLPEDRCGARCPTPGCGKSCHEPQGHEDLHIHGGVCPNWFEGGREWADGDPPIWEDEDARPDAQETEGVEKAGNPAVGTTPVPAQPIWESLRERVRALRAQGKSYSGIARELGVARTTVWRYAHEGAKPDDGQVDE